MKSNTSLIVIALLALILAVASSVIVWDDVGSPVKIAMYALGFGSGVGVGGLMARRPR
ncbi:MAG TPA: hypothetical protein VK900_10140 [Anaerolineales bacterium]|nr:hypothetical protein [Anaerolineales bacterium]